MRISDWSSDVCSSDLLDPAIKVTATCVRVPVFVGHAEALNIEFERPITEEQARKALAAQPGCIVVDHRANEGYVTPAECAGEDAVYVSRRSEEHTSELQSLMRISYAVFCLKKKKQKSKISNTQK